MTQAAILVLEDGTVFEGTSVGAPGQSVGEAMRWLKLSPADVVVFYDEIDLAAAIRTTIHPDDLVVLTLPEQAEPLRQNIRRELQRIHG